MPGSDAPPDPLGHTAADPDRETAAPSDPQSDTENTHERERAMDPESQRDPAADPEPEQRPAADVLFVLEAADNGTLEVMRGSERIAELPAFSTWPGFAFTGTTELTANEHFLLFSHLGYREVGLSPLPEPEVPGAQPEGSVVQRVMLVRRSDFKVLWQRTSEPVSYAYSPRVGLDGQVVISEQPAAEEVVIERTIVVGLDGRAHAIDGISALSAPDSDGWFIARTSSTDTGGDEYGFAHVDQPALQPLREALPIADEGYPYYQPFIDTDVLATVHYISEDAGGELALVSERHDGVIERSALGLSPTGRATVLRGANSALVLSVHGAGTLKTWQRIDADGVVHGASPEESELGFPSGMVTNDWFPFSTGGSYVTTGWLDGRSGELTHAPEPPNGMLAFGMDYCTTTPELLDNGRVAVGLIEGDVGGAYIAEPDGTLTRVGLPIANALFVEIQHTGGTLQLSAIDGRNRYCGGPAAITHATNDDGALLLGGQTQLLRGERSLVLEDPSGYGVQLDPSGRFALEPQEDGTIIHDLDAGTRQVLPAGARLVGWL